MLIVSILVFVETSTRIPWILMVSNDDTLIVTGTIRVLNKVQEINTISHLYKHQKV